MFKVLIRRDSNREPLVSEAITLRTEPPPCPKLLKLYLCGSTNLRMVHHSLPDDWFAKKGKKISFAKFASKEMFAFLESLISIGLLKLCSN